MARSLEIVPRNAQYGCLWLSLGSSCMYSKARRFIALPHGMPHRPQAGTSPRMANHLGWRNYQCEG
jgi:hypothetical protein